MLYDVDLQLPDGRHFVAYVDDKGHVDHCYINGKVANASETEEVRTFVEQARQVKHIDD